MANVFVPEGSLIGTPENTEFTSCETALELAMRCGRILEAQTLCCDKDMNLSVGLCGIIGIIPRDEVVYSPDSSPVKDIAIITRVGKPVCFKIVGIMSEGDSRRVILSRAAAQRECMESYLSGLEAGDIIPCRVTHTEKFGAFVDVGCGVTALLPVDCISVSRITHSSERLRVGSHLRCAVKAIEKPSFRMLVTLKELLGTWEENAALFTPGQTVRGIVRGVEDYGVFIELMPNLSGLAEYRHDVYPDQDVTVYIKSIDREKMKIKLVIVSEATRIANAGINYFVDGMTNHISSWQYSPISARKNIFTCFDT